VVSHDQVFLDAICTDIIELKSQLAGQSKSCLTHYSGDYSTYTNTVDEQRVAQLRLRAAFEKERDKLKEFIARDGKKYDNPAHQSQRKVSDGVIVMLMMIMMMIIIMLIMMMMMMVMMVVLIMMFVVVVMVVSVMMMLSVCCHDVVMENEWIDA